MRSSTQRRRERHYVAELIRRATCDDVGHAIAADIDAYVYGWITYSSFRELQRYWTNQNPRSLNRLSIRQAFHREAGLASSYIESFLCGMFRYQERAWQIRRTALSLRCCQLIDVPPCLTTPLLRQMATDIAEQRDWGAMPLLYDAMIEAGCDHTIARHCKEEIHGRGCFVLEGLR